MERVLTFEQETSHFCCGLEEIGGFQVEREENIDTYWGIFSDRQWPPKSTDKAYYATTLRTQTGSIKRLKKMGFKKLGAWTRDTGVVIYLWGYFPRKKKRKRK